MAEKTVEQSFTTPFGFYIYDEKVRNWLFIVGSLYPLIHFSRLTEEIHIIPLQKKQSD